MPPTTRWIIGAAESCDIRVSSAFVSARHCRLDLDGDHWVITDLGSTNGTYVNGLKIKSPTIISDDDTVTLGRSFPLPWPSSAARPSRPHVDPAARPSPTGPGDRPAGLRLEARRLSVDVGGRRLLDDVSLVFSPGELVGIMGPSGAGKSTLLQALAGTSTPATGVVLAGQLDLYEHGDRARGLVGYVPQDDIMHTDLTVARALRYAARLRLPSSFSDRDIETRIGGVLDQLDIASTANARIGSPERRGISGGQRKRVNVAFEMLTDPPILVLDEPTSGLSSTDALTLMRLLRRLASAGRTVILTIHQPSVEVLRMFDAIAVIGKDRSTRDRGTLVWYGPPLPDAMAFFDPGGPATAGSCDPDGILRGLLTRTVSQWRAAYLATGTYRQWIVEKPYVEEGQATVPRPPRPRRPGVLRQFMTLCARMLAVKVGDAWNTALLLLQAPVIAALIAAVFSGRTLEALDEASWARVTPALGMTTFLLALTAVWFGCSNAAREIVAERAIYRREHLAGLSATAYLGSKIAVLTGFCLIQCAILLSIVVPWCGLKGDLPTAFLLLVLAAQTGTALGLALSATARTPEVAAAALPLLIIPMVILGGILLPLSELPAFTAPAADVMPSRWAFEGLIVNEAGARTTLTVPDPAHPGSSLTRDVATQWFPAPDWRQPAGLPVTILALLWGLGNLAAFSWLQPATTGRRRGSR